MYQTPIYRYKVYNPKETKLQDVLDQGPIECFWLLLQVLKVSDTESVAIFRDNR